MNRFVKLSPSLAPLVSTTIPRASFLSRLPRYFPAQRSRYKSTDKRKPLFKGGYPTEKREVLPHPAQSGKQGLQFFDPSYTAYCNGTVKALTPYIFCHALRKWRGLRSVGRKLKQEATCLGRETLRLVSWNIDPVSPYHAERATAAMDHLRECFDERSLPPTTSPTSSQPQPQLSPLVVMLQGVQRDSLSAILRHNWVQDNFVISIIAAPDPARQRHFSMLLVSRGLKTLISGDDGEGWFRVRLGNNPDHNALFVDILIDSFAGKQGSVGTERKTEKSMEVLRFSTVNFGPPPNEGQDCRPPKLADVAAKLRGPSLAGKRGVRITGCMVGGDMNSLRAQDVARHRDGHVSLRDVWEEPVSPAAPNCQDDSTGRSSGPSETAKDQTYGREGGHTHGYQPPENGAMRRDKFFYHGESLEVHSIRGAQDWSRKVGRVGIGLIVKIVTGEHTKYVWVSDHFGICVGVKMR